MKGIESAGMRPCHCEMKVSLQRARERERERGREKGGERKEEKEGKKGRKTKDDPFSLNKLYHCPGLIHHLAKHNTAY